MRKTIKLNFVGFWSDFNKEQNLFTDILREKYNIEISEKPDFIFASLLGNKFEYLKYDCVRILFAGEPLVPNFNVFDYAIGFDYISFPDNGNQKRYYRYPLCFYSINTIKTYIKGLTYIEAKKSLQQKKYFCNFLYGHQSAKGEREKIFSEIQKYRRVESAGTFLNNMPDGRIIPYSDKKREFLKECKFTIACESISYPGFTTEKLVDPICAHSIPIYYGNPFVSQEFNSKAIVNLHEFASFEEGLDFIKKIDQDDELYIKMLMEPKLASADYFNNMIAGLKEFLFSIFAQSPDNAYRRMRYYIQKQHEDCLKEYRQFTQSLEYRVFKKLHS